MNLLYAMSKAVLRFWLCFEMKVPIVLWFKILVILDNKYFNYIIWCIADKTFSIEVTDFSV